MINGLYLTKAEGVDNILLNILKNRDHDAIRDTVTDSPRSQEW